MPTMTEADLIQFIDSVAGASLATKAATCCIMAGLPVTEETCAATYGQWIDPGSPLFERMVILANGHVREMVATAAVLGRPFAGSA